MCSSILIVCPLTLPCLLPSMAFTGRKWGDVELTAAPDAPGVYLVTLNKPPENRIDAVLAQDIIAALRYTETTLLGRGQAGAVVLTSFSNKFFCTGVDMEEAARNPLASADGFFPLIATILDYPYPVIAAVTGHTFGGACPLVLSCDYRLMNRNRGFLCMPPADLGLHFDGIGFLPRLKLRPPIARKMLLEAHRWTADEAEKDGVIDEAVNSDVLLQKAIEKARAMAPKAKMGVYALLRNELYGEALEALQKVAHRHHRTSGGRLVHKL